MTRGEERKKVRIRDEERGDRLIGRDREERKMTRGEERKKVRERYEERGERDDKG
jgi:hypothetical protein